MVELEEKLLEYLDVKKKNCSLEEIKNELDVSENDLLVEAIDNLEKKGKIFRNKKGEFLIWHNGLNRLYGNIIITSRGMGILRDENANPTFIHKGFLNGAQSGDTVIVGSLKNVRIPKKGKGKDTIRQEGKVEKVLVRNREEILCEVNMIGGRKYLKPLSKNDEAKIRVPLESLKEYVDGDRLLVKVGTEKEGESYLGKVVKKVCHKNDPHSDLMSIAASNGFSFDFTKEVMDEVKNIPTTIENEDISDRVDLRDKMIFTIDGVDTKDMDDAISLDILPNGNYKLGVHIADVAHYVKPGTALYEEAKKRGTSVYMLYSVLPMLPRELSNGICSLNPNEDRLTKTCEMEIDRNGNVVNSKIYNSVIRSRKKMNYDAVNEILENNTIPEGYDEYADTLIKMGRLSDLLNKKRKKRGSIDFDGTETKIKTDEKGYPYDVFGVKQRSAELLIENYMLHANEEVAKTVFKNNLPFIYRIHDMPNTEKLYKTIKMIDKCNPSMEININDLSNPKDISKFMDYLSTFEGHQAYSNVILRCMSKAEYSSNNIGHFGLALRYYTHFTSPIRRFPDLLVHQLLDLYSNEKVENIDLSELEKKIEEIAISSSVSERNAARAEFDANDMKCAEYMQDHIGEEYEGTITDVNSHGMSVTLDNSISGVVNIGDIEPKRFYTFDHNSYTLVTNDNHYKLGDRVHLRVKDATKEYKRINFVVTGHVKEKDKPKVKKLV